MTRYQIICIDDDKEFLGSVKGSLPDKVKPLCKDFDCVFDFVTSSTELREVLAQAAESDVCPAILISDQLMPDVNGLKLIEQIKGDYPDLVCILLTGHAELDSARQAINRHGRRRALTICRWTTASNAARRMKCDVLNCRISPRSSRPKVIDKSFT